MNKYYNINNLFDENGEPIKVTLKIKRKNNYIDYKAAYETSFEYNKFLSKKYNEVKELADHYKHLYSEVKKQKDDVVEYIRDKCHYYLCDAFRYDYEEKKHKKEIEDLLRMLGEIDVKN